MESLKVVPEFVPKIRDDRDTSNFDSEFTDKPVTEDKEDKNRDETDFEKYYEEMFEGFSFYNYSY